MKIMINLKTYFNGFTIISTKSWNEFELLFTKRILKKGDYFIKDGQIAKEIGFLESGIVSVFYISNNGVNYNKHFFINPSLIGGYSSLISKKPTQINQQALTDCVVYVAKYSEIVALYSTCPDIERASRILAEQFFIQKEQREIEIVLLDAQHRYDIFKEQFPQLDQQIPQYQIASYLGITPTQLSRIRKKMSSK